MQTKNIRLRLLPFFLLFSFLSILFLLTSSGHLAYPFTLFLLGYTDVKVISELVILSFYIFIPAVLFSGPICFFWQEQAALKIKIPLLVLAAITGGLLYYLSAEGYFAESFDYYVSYLSDLLFFGGVMGIFALVYLRLGNRNFKAVLFCSVSAIALTLMLLFYAASNCGLNFWGGRDFCHSFIAEYLEEPGHCEKISDTRSRDICYMSIASKSRRTEIANLSLRAASKGPVSGSAISSRQETGQAANE